MDKMVEKMTAVGAGTGGDQKRKMRENNHREQ